MSSAKNIFSSLIFTNSPIDFVLFSLDSIKESILFIFFPLANIIIVKISLCSSKIKSFSDILSSIYCRYSLFSNIIFKIALSAFKNPGSTYNFDPYSSLLFLKLFSPLTLILLLRISYKVCSFIPVFSDAFLI